MKKLQTKDLGTLGEIAIAKHLMERGLPIFKEIGDNSPVDLIVLYKCKIPIRIQVKTLENKKGSVKVRAINRNRNRYIRTYKQDDFDIFAVYVYEQRKIFYVTLKEVLKCKSKELTIRTKPSKNNQIKGVHFMNEYRSFSRAVKQVI